VPAANQKEISESPVEPRVKGQCCMQPDYSTTELADEQTQHFIWTALNVKENKLDFIPHSDHIQGKMKNVYWQDTITSWIKSKWIL